MREYKVMASSMTGTYTAGRHIAETTERACELAREAYRKSALGRQLKDVGAYRFYVVSKFPDEDTNTD